MHIDPYNHMEIARPKDGYPNRPCYYKPEMEEVTTGCQRKSWGTHRKRSCAGGGNRVLDTTKDKTRIRKTTAI